MGTLLHTYKHMPCTTFNRVFAFIYTCAILALIYHHLLTLRHSTTFISVVATTSLLISDLILAFAWATTTSFRLRPILRKAYPENLEKVIKTKDFPRIDIFICTADPYKEPPMNVVNTALSLMAYDYPPEKLSVYVSDDGGSELTLFAFMEAAKFAKIWLPFCRENNIMDRCPEVYFSSNHHGRVELGILEEIKIMYENMKIRVENVVERGEVCPYYITSESQHQAFNKFRTPGFTRVNHPTIIQVLIECAKEKDKKGQLMPNLVYLSREKNQTSGHNFKAGALNCLLRVSSIMTNAPIVLTQDCDMYSNDPQTPKMALCYIIDPLAQPKLGYVQFPQRYHGINKNDIYGGDFLRLFVANPVGADGLRGPHYVGTGCFFLRRAFFGGPTSVVLPEIQELRPDHVVEKPITTQPIIELAHHVARCDYENNTKWGFQNMDGRGRGRGRGRGADNINLTQDQLTALINQAVGAYAANHPVHAGPPGCTYKMFLDCKPPSYSGAEKAVGLIRWFEKLESVFAKCNCPPNDQVNFATGMLEGAALAWWNAQVQAMGLVAANALTWLAFKDLYLSLSLTPCLCISLPHFPFRLFSLATGKMTDHHRSPSKT